MLKCILCERETKYAGILCSELFATYVVKRQMTRLKDTVKKTTVQLIAEEGARKKRLKNVAVSEDEDITIIKQTSK